VTTAPDTKQSTTEPAANATTEATTADATFGVDAQKADWKAQAAKKAQEYLDYDSFSRSGLIKQLEFEGFTPAQAAYGAKKVGL